MHQYRALLPDDARSRAPRFLIQRYRRQGDSRAAGTQKNKPSLAIEKALRSKVPSPLGNQPVIRRCYWQLLTGALREVRVAHDDGAVAVQKQKILIAHRCDGLIDTLEIGEPDSG